MRVGRKKRHANSRITHVLPVIKAKQAAELHCLNIYGIAKSHVDQLTQEFNTTTGGYTPKQRKAIPIFLYQCRSYRPTGTPSRRNRLPPFGPTLWSLPASSVFFCHWSMSLLTPWNGFSGDGERSSSGAALMGASCSSLNFARARRIGEGVRGLSSA